MTIRTIGHRLATALAIVAVLTSSAACDITYNLATADLRAQAKDDWSRTYSVAANGRLEIANTNGDITVVPSDGPGIEVKAERVGKGRDEQAAKQVLDKVTIVEEQTGDTVRIQTKVDRGGSLRDPNAHVSYRVRVPRGVSVKLSNTNGAIEVTGLRGGVEVATTNGAITGHDLGGALKAETVNGGVTLGVAQLSEGGITAQTVNGSVKVNLPADARATLRVRTTNGGIDVNGFTLEDADKARTRLNGRINGGGAPIDLQTVNGGVTISRSTT